MTTGTTIAIRVYLIRHGETEWSLLGRHTGKTDLPLTARGEAEVRKIAPLLADVGFTRMLVSPRARARRTCTLAGMDHDTEIDPDLAEWDYGDYEGLRSIDIRQQREDWNLFRHGCPNGETPEQVSRRADRVIARVRASNGNVGIFSHGHFISVLAARWIGLPLHEAEHFKVRTASVSILGFDAHHPEVSVIELWNGGAQDAPGLSRAV